MGHYESDNGGDEGGYGGVLSLHATEVFTKISQFSHDFGVLPLRNLFPLTQLRFHSDESVV